MAVQFPLVGLAGERQRVLNALRKPESLLVLGPAGSGKTRLLRSALESAGTEALYIPYLPVLHDLLAFLASVLISESHPGFVQAAGDPRKWASRQTSVHLRGLLWRVLEAHPRPLIVDGVYRSGFQAYRFFQRLYHLPGMAIIAAARDLVRLGALQRLFWDPRQAVHLPPLAQAEALRLFHLAVDRFQLRGLDLDDFGDRALESAQGNPGQIIEMCRLAADPRYLSGRHVKFAPLRIDMMMKFLA
jgi:hypothetical protein